MERATAARRLARLAGRLVAPARRPLLVELIGAAENASPNVASAAARVAEARSTRVQAGAALLPSLDGTVGQPRHLGLPSGAPTTGSSTAASSGSELSASTPVTTLQAGLQSKWEIDLFGRLRADRDAAQAKQNSANAKWHDARVAVAAETANAYFAERACQEQLRVSESDARSRSRPRASPSSRPRPASPRRPTPRWHAPAPRTPRAA
jgi:multidrug efflux system outer membrane protein